MCHYANGTVCNNPNVNIMNTNTGESWAAENASASNYYQLVLNHGADIVATELLEFDVKSPDGSQVNVTNCTITQQEINDGGLFNFNISLAAIAMIHDVNVSTDYEGAVNGIKILKDGAAIPDSQSLTIGEDYTIRSRIVNEGDFDETVNVTIEVANDTDTVFLENFEKIINVSSYKDAYRTWDTSGLAPGEYNITVNASIPEDAYPDDNERLRPVTLVLPTTPGAPDITDWYPVGTEVYTSEGESATFNITINQTVNVSWQINGTEVFNETGVNESAYANDSAAVGYWNVSAIVENVNGTDMHTWMWKVTSIEVATISIGDATASPGETTTVLLTIYNATNAGVVDVNLTYNQSIVRVIDVAGCDFDTTIPNLEHEDTGFIRIGAFQTGNP